MSESGTQEPRSVVVASEAGLAIRSPRDVMDMIGAAYDADGIVLTPDDVDPSFFDLHSGLAGELFQKVTNYGLRLAFVVPDPSVHGPRWADLAAEHADHRTIRFLPSKEAAVAWVRSGRAPT